MNTTPCSMRGFLRLWGTTHKPLSDFWIQFFFIQAYVSNLGSKEAYHQCTPLNTCCSLLSPEIRRHNIVNVQFVARFDTNLSHFKIGCGAFLGDTILTLNTVSPLTIHKLMFLRGLEVTIIRAYSTINPPKVWFWSILLSYHRTYLSGNLI